MATKQTTTAAPVNSKPDNAMYRVTVKEPFIFERTQFIPSPTMTYEVDGRVLSAIKDKIADFEKIS